MVVRFNRGSEAAPSDLGSKLDIWMGLLVLILIGAETHWVLQDWSRFRVAVDNGLPTLTMPRAIWREAVEALKAPPSAGFLLLGWLRWILGGRKSLGVAEIGTQAQMPPSGGILPPPCPAP
jgi:hypothetical protein